METRVPGWDGNPDLAVANSTPAAEDCALALLSPALALIFRGSAVEDEVQVLGHSTGETPRDCHQNRPIPRALPFQGLLGRVCAVGEPWTHVLSYHSASLVLVPSSK